MLKRIFAFCTLLACLTSSAVRAQAPSTIGYQGILTDGNGVAVPNGAQTITFRLYAAASGGSALWTETQSVTTTSGAFSAVLGSVTALNISFNQALYLGISVGSGAELTPRIALTASPYSLIAKGVEDGAVSSSKIADNAVTTVKIAGGAVTTTQIADGSVTTAKLAGGAVTSAQIADNAVTGAKVASGQVVKSVNTLKDDMTLAAGSNVTITPSGNTLTIAATGAALADNTVTAAKIADGAVTSAKLANSAVTATQLADNAVTGAKITDGTVATADLADNAVTTTKIADGTVATADLADNAVTSAKIVDGTIAAGDIADGTLTGLKFSSGQVVKSLNTLKDDLTLAAGSNITITPTGNTLTIAATGGSGNTLDQAYDQGGAGSGRTITADAGAVNIAGAGGLTVNGSVGIGTTSPGAGDVATGVTVELPVALYNPGNDTLRLDSLRVTPSGAFTLAAPRPNPVLAPRDSQVVTVSFRPAASGDHAGSLTASTNDPDRRGLSIPLGGAGVTLSLTMDLNPADGNQKQTTAGGVRPGKRVPAQLFVEDAPLIRGFTVRIGFDPKMMAFVTGSFSAGPVVPGLIGLVDLKRDYVEVGGTTLGGGTGGGSGLLGTLSFEALAGFEGETALRIPLVIWDRGAGGRQTIRADVQAALSSPGGRPSPDFDGDGEVGFNDFFLFANVFGSSDARFDLDGDGNVGFTDFFLFADAFGKRT